MGPVITQDVIESLRRAGIPAEHAYPGTPIPKLSGVAAAVYLGNADYEKQTQTVVVNLMAPSEMEAESCERKALQAAYVLQCMGARCRIDMCRSDGKGGLVYVPVSAVFSAGLPVVKLDGAVLPGLVSFSSGRKLEGNLQELSAADWHFRIEEFFPTAAEEPAPPREPFSLEVNGWDYYGMCSLTSETRLPRDEGLLRIREGIASSYKIGK